jgi:hypothetical protein
MGDSTVYLQYTLATATFNGKPVVVLAFTRRAEGPSSPTEREAQAPQAPPPVTLTVMAQEGCAQVLSRPL